ncbi:hypothetical protein GCM10022406_15430 [Hymenobacter algoricola]|uniref:Uncharacterized protein n=1 Tax=Hymenobacter algoricola TaxID=486267 RepID=A0ABP7MVZ2_9BACT
MEPEVVPLVEPDIEPLVEAPEVEPLVELSVVPDSFGVPELVDEQEDRAAAAPNSSAITLVADGLLVGFIGVVVRLRKCRNGHPGSPCTCPLPGSLPSRPKHSFPGPSPRRAYEPQDPLSVGQARN